MIGRRGRTLGKHLAAGEEKLTDGAVGYARRYPRQDGIIDHALRKIRHETRHRPGQGRKTVDLALILDFIGQPAGLEHRKNKFPVPGIGPLSLLKETRINHLGKLAFRAIYWNLLLPGRHMPLVGSRMSTAGKDLEVLQAYQ